MAGLISDPSTGGTGATADTRSSDSATAAPPDASANFTVPSGVTNVVLTDTAPQTIHANNLGDTITLNDYGSTIVGGKGDDTLIAGTGADHLTGGAGSDTFVFNALPTNAGQITDFNHGGDTLDLSGIFSSIGYAGTNPSTDGYLSFVSDHHGDTNVYVDAHNGAGQVLVTTLDHVSPGQISASDWVWHH